MDKQTFHNYFSSNIFYNNKIKSLLFLIIIICSIFISCKINNQKIINFEFNIERYDTIVIKLSDTIPDMYLARNWNYNDNSLSFLMYIEELILYIYNFESTSWRQINLSHFKDDRIEFHGSFGYINDSIIIYNHSYKNEILIIDLSNKEVITKYYLPPDFLTTMTDNLTYYYDSSIIILPVVYDNLINNKYANKARLAMSIVNKSGEMSLHGPYPSEFKINEQTSVNKLNPDIVIHKYSLVLSFKSEEKLYIYSLVDSNYSSIMCKDKNVKNHSSYSQTGDEYKNAMNEEFTGLYKEFIYDREKKLYYRISLGYPNFDGQIPRSIEELSKIVNTRELTVSVLDSNLKMIAQNVLSGVSEINYFTRCGKLYLRKAISNENEINFIGFELVSKMTN